MLGLSPRQREVLQLASYGKSNLEIANELDLSVHTIKHHFSDAYNKVIVNASKNSKGLYRTEAVAWALREGIIE